MDRRVFLVALAAGLAPAAPSSAHEFRAYFDYGEAILQPGGYVMTREVARYLFDPRWGPRGEVESVTVEAHLDTREAVEFSDELARRRGQSVASELVLLGVRPELIEIKSWGALRLALPTSDNVAEPLNRRVLVDVRLRRHL